MDWKIVVAAPLVAWLVVANAATLKMPRNWGSDVHAPSDHAYLLGIDPEVHFNGHPALAVRSQQPLSDIDFGAATHYVDTYGYEGHRVRFSGMLKTSDASTWAGVFLAPVSGVASRDWMFTDKQSLPFGSVPTTGTVDWHPVSVVMDVPSTPDASISLGLAVVGSGQAWLSDLKFEEVGIDVPLTDTRIGLNIEKLAKLRAEPEHSAPRVKQVPELDLKS